MTKKIIQETSQTEIKPFVNIRQFTLAAGVNENGPEIDAIRRYVKTKDESVISKYIKSGKIVAMDEKHNIIVDAGLEELAKSMSGERATTPDINYGLLGTGTPDVAANRTQLVTESFRKVAASRSHDKNIIYIDLFFDAADCSGTYTEFGNVIDGTASANTGTLFSYIATGGWVKTASQSLFISCEYHLNNA